MITLQHNGNLLLLPNPQFPNTDTVNIKIKVAHSMDGTIYTTRYTPHSDNFLINVIGLTKDKKDQSIDFFDTVSGETVTYTAEDGTVYNGYVRVQEIVFNQVSRRYELSIKFEEAI